MTTINTVNGALDIDDLGVTLMHEHVMIGYPGWEADTLRPGPRREEMLAVCADRIAQMQARGIQSMVDPCPNDLGRDVVFSAEVSARTGFNIICATGLYKQEEGGAAYWHFRANFGPVVEAMAELFIHELTVGIGDTGIKAGIIKIATGKDQITEYEHSIIQAAAIAAVETGAPITTHTEEGTMGDEQQRLLLEAGVPAHKIIIGHSCGTSDHDYHLHILDQGSYLGFDRFGLNILYPDDERVRSLVALLQKQREQQLVVSHDSVWCWRGEPIPPEVMATLDDGVTFNPTHFHDTIIPRLLQAGVTQAQIDAMLVDNPHRFFAGQAPGALAA
ncbi:MAG: phosphotriesterase-related protein [Gammaproteobacteria bacterium]|nr:phosphotriesterase-related protein [Gammaproteobacteria bacterium]